MAWITPLTAISTAALTSAQWNASVRDNLLETAPAKATAAGRIFVSTGANAIAERAISSAAVSTSEGTPSTIYAVLTTPGPAVTVTTGAAALVLISSVCSNSTSANNAYASYAVSSATTIAASDDRSTWLYSAAAAAAARIGISHLETALTPGSNIFTMQYRVSGGTGTFANRRIIVVGL